MQEQDAREGVLLELAQRGDADAFEQLLAPYERKLYATCLRMMGSPEDAQDAMQETMLRIWRGLSSFQTRAQFGTWAYRVATNTCLDAIRKKKLRVTASLDALAEQGFSPPDNPAASPEEALLAQIRREAVLDALQALPSDARAALVLRDMQGEPYEAVAEATGATLGTVKSRIHRAREKMAKLLMKDAELFEKRRVQGEEGRQA